MTRREKIAVGAACIVVATAALPMVYHLIWLGTGPSFTSLMLSNSHSQRWWRLFAAYALAAWCLFKGFERRDG